MRFYFALVIVLTFLCCGCVHRHNYCCSHGPVFPRLHERLRGDCCSYQRGGILDCLHHSRPACPPCDCP